MASCNFKYKGKEFSSKEEVAEYIEKEKPSPSIQRDLFFLMQNSEKGVTEEDLQRQDKIIADLKTNKGNTITKDKEGYLVNGKRVMNRVTDKAKAFLSFIFKNREINQTEYEKRVNDLKAEEGTRVHKMIEDIIDLFVDKDGYIRDVPKDDSVYLASLNPNDNLIYRQIRANIKNRLASFPEGTRFLSEVMVYDPVKDEAGTMDFVAITPKGKVSILDWKTINLNIKKHSDIPSYKQDYWRTQIKEYKQILIDNYGVDKNDFQKTEAIPIKTTFTPGDAAMQILPVLTKIEIGKVNPTEETTDYLLPVPLKEQSTGNEEVDSILEKLYALEAKFKSEKVVENRKDLKAEQIRAIQTAARKLQVQMNIDGILEQAEIYNKRVTKTLSDYALLKEKDPKTLKKAQISAMADEFFDADVALEIYSELYTYLKDVVNETSRKKLSDLSQDAREKKLLISKAEEEFVVKFIAEKHGVFDLLMPEAVIKGFQKMFTSLSEGATKSMATLWQLVSMTKQRVDIQIDEDNKELNKLKEDYTKWAEGKGLSKKNMFDILIKKGKHALIDQYRPSFYEECKKAIEERDRDWISENIDLDAYSKWASEYYEIRKQQIKDNVYAGTDKQVQDRKRKEMEKLEEEFSIENMIYNEKIKKFPLPKNYSNEYKELKSNPPALALFEYITKKNNHFREIGYINAASSRTFLPYISKGLMEKLILGGDVRLGEQFLHSISVDAGEVGYGHINPQTGAIEDKLPRYFTQAIDDPSKDLFRVLSLTNAVARKYEYFSEIEAQVRALNRIEKAKPSLLTSDFGEALFDKAGNIRVTSDNKRNSELLEEMTKAVFYGQKYINSEQFDQVLGGLGTFSKFGKAFNEKIGIKVLPESTEGKKVSATKTIDAINTLFQQKVLGLNFLSSLSSFLGGSFQNIINAGRFFTRQDFIKSEFDYTTQRILSSPDGKKMVMALKYFLPFTSSVANEQSKKLSLAITNRHSLSDVLMSLMRNADEAVQGSVFFSMLKNTVVIDGELVNAREYIRKSSEYQKRYNTPSEIAKIEKEFEEKVKKLIEEKGLLKLAKIENDEFVIPGIDRTSDTVLKLRRLTQSISKDSLGNMTEDDARRINLTVLGRSFMMFKNWIPRLAEVRFGKLKYNEALAAYEWGRAAMAFRFIGTEFLKAHTNLYNALKANEKGIEFLHKMYLIAKKDYENRTGTPFKMTPEEFYDMVRQNLRANIRDFVAITVLMSAFLMVKTNDPDDDEDESIKSYHKYLVRALDKVSDELSFFYSPWGWESILSGSMFPALGLFTDIRNIVTHFASEMWGMAVENDELVQKSYPIKYTMKSIPVFKEVANYLTVFWPDVAKEYGMRQQTQGRR